jgi:Protein of unknown function (DUF501)
VLLLTFAWLPPTAAVPIRNAALRSLSVSSTDASRTEITIAGHKLEQISKEDLICIEERQLLHKVAAASVGARCLYGFPQVGLARTSADPLICTDASFHNALCCPSCTLKAFAYHPCEYSVSSGLFRLSCPKLVQAIDQYEREGAINEYNKQLMADEEWQQSFDAANLVTRDIRRELVDTYPGGIDKVRQLFEVKN